MIRTTPKMIKKFQELRSIPGRNGIVFKGR